MFCEYLACLHSLNTVFWRTEVFTFKFSLSISHSQILLFVLYPESHHWTQGHLNFFLCSRCFIVLCFIFRAVIHFELIFVKDTRSFTSGCSFVQYRLLNKKTPFSLTCLCFVKNQLTVFLWVYFWAFYSIPSIYLPFLLPISCSLEYCGLMVCLMFE